MSAETPEDQRRQEAEAHFTFFRAHQLELSPIRGSYDAAHLKAINRHIFQDLPGLGFADVKPGQFRTQVPAGLDWVKNRTFESLNISATVAYSTMDSEALKELDRILHDADPAKLGKLNTANFTKAIGDLYAKLDYIHPFSDGNSRTLRAFTHQLAKEAGYELDWTRFAKTKHGRDILYVARDLSVNKIAQSRVRNGNTLRDIDITLHQFSENRDLPDLLKDAIRPARAIAFEKLSETEAVKLHPELAEAFNVMRSAHQYFHVGQGDDATKHAAFTAVVAHVKARIEEGEVSGFRPKISQPHRGQDVRRAPRAPTERTKSLPSKSQKSRPPKGTDFER